MSFWDSFVILPGRGVHYLLALFQFGIVLFGFLARPPLGGCQFLVMLLIWLPPVLMLCGRLWLRVWVVRFTGLVVLVLDGKTTRQKTPAHLAGLVLQSRPRVWKRLCHVEHSFVSIPDRKRRRNDQMMGDTFLLRSGLGLGKSVVLCKPTSPGLHVFN